MDRPGHIPPRIWTMARQSGQRSGTSVYQRVKAGVSCCAYKLRCTATDSGAGNETYVLTASLGVVTA